ncbi:hypothetical protein ACQCSX_09135 [Pseudarthrobacter sp. P1]|uniref:hypothetical protein n=1 Tax=Pseudarthrobacter sp. P1 TaxID=3418418 RepID=UPI003CF7609D
MAAWNLWGDGPGCWIADALAPYHSRERRGLAGSTVAATVPDSFEAYVRILHPVVMNTLDINGTFHFGTTTWADVAAKTGRTIHPAVQFAAITGLPRGEQLILGDQHYGNPIEGRLEPFALAALADVVGRFTSTPGDVYLAIWDGWGGLHEGTSVSYVPAAEEGAAATAAQIQEAFDLALRQMQLRGLSEEMLDSSMVDVANGYRCFYVERSTIAGLAAPPWNGEALPQFTQSPNLAWPEDRAWCLATEIDFDSTLVGGSRELIAAIVAHPGLEALPVELATDLAWHADTVNPLPGDSGG